jgi:hypothetical protein
LIFIHCSIYEIKNDVVVELKFDRVWEFSEKRHVQVYSYLFDQ